VDIVGQWMTMWQESCQAKCGRQKSRYETEEGWIAKQISGGRFGFWGRGGKDFF
jgi:hypothetical protein